MLVEILIFFITFLIAYFFYTHWRQCKHFENHGIKYLPGVPIFGNNLKATLLKNHVSEDFEQVYSAFPDEKYVGFLEGTARTILIRDPELIKSITVKDFEYFINHKEFFPVEVNPLLNASLFGMKDDKWKDMRTTLTPAFTGSKMRLMMPFMKEISNNVVQYLRDHQGEDIDLDDLARRYANDVIASAGFGMQVNSLKDRDCEFYKMGQDVFNFTVWQRIVIFVIMEFPFLAKYFGSGTFPQTTSNFLRKIVLDTMEFREKNDVERPDMIQLLMQASKGTLKINQNEKNDTAGFATADEALKNHKTAREWTTHELVSQVFLFFVAGFETSASAAVMAIHELALNPDPQEKLYKEIKSYHDTKGDISYENLLELKYLDCVLNETLRKWSAAIVLDRICAKTYELPPPREGGKPYRLQPGQLIYNSVNGMHGDPKYYPQPEVWDPERFSEENRHKIKPFTFLPFGMGPRNCIGSRFAIMEVKTLLFYLVLNFKIVKCSKTMDPIKLRKRDFNIMAADGSWVRFEARK